MSELKNHLKDLIKVFVDRAKEYVCNGAYSYDYFLLDMAWFYWCMGYCVKGLYQYVPCSYIG